MKRRFRPCPKPTPLKARPASRAATQIKPTPRKKSLPKASTQKAKPGYVRRMFTLSLREYRILQICMQERGLDPGSYNAALQTILVEWKALKDQVHHPVLIAVPADMLPKNKTHGEE